MFFFNFPSRKNEKSFLPKKKREKAKNGRMVKATRELGIIDRTKVYSLPTLENIV